MSRMVRTLAALLVAVTAAAAPAAAQFTKDSAPEAPKPKDAKADTVNAPGPWKFNGTVAITATQSSYSTNWQGGDRGSWTWVSRFDGAAERQVSRTFNTLNSLVLAYGQTSRQQLDPADPAQRVWEPPVKSTDQITFETVGRFTLSSFADPYFAYRLDSQFLDQSEPNGNLTFNPVRMKLSAGLAKVLMKDDDHEIITRFGLGARATFGSMFTELAPSQTTASYHNNDAGLEWVTTATLPMLSKRARYKGRLGLFQAFSYSQSGALEDYDVIAAAADPAHRPIADYWKTLDVNFENVFSAKITANLGVELTAQLIYDKFDSAVNVDTTLDPAVLIPSVEANVRRAGQFRESLALALSYRLF
jgi:hypothetical protein